MRSVLVENAGCSGLNLMFPMGAPPLADSAPQGAPPLADSAPQGASIDNGT